MPICNLAKVHLEGVPSERDALGREEFLDDGVDGLSQRGRPAWRDVQHTCLVFGSADGEREALLHLVASERIEDLHVRGPAEIPNFPRGFRRDQPSV